MATKVPIILKISYAALKEALHLPDDVDVLGIPGIRDDGGIFTLLVETPTSHISTANLGVHYERTEAGIRFKGFG